MKKHYGWLVFTVMVAATFCGTAPAVAGRTEFSMGLGGGYFFPLGEWNEHPYAGVDQFGGSLTAHMDFELRFTRHIGMAIDIRFSNLDTGAWEDFAASAGDNVDALANIVQFGLQFKPHPWEDRWHSLAIMLGMYYCVVYGQEEFDDTEYEYDFLKNRFGYQLGVELNRYINRNVAFTVSVSGTFIPNAVDYVSGVDHDVIGVPVTVGVRYVF